MTTRIKLKRGTGAPNESQLDQYEVAMDPASGVIYVGGASTDPGTDAAALANNITDINELNDADGLLLTAEGLSKAGDILIENTGGLNYKFHSNVGGPFAHRNTATELRVDADSNTDLLNATSLLTIGQNSFLQYLLTDTGGGDDGSHNIERTIFGGEVTLTHLDKSNNNDPVVVNNEANTHNFKPTTAFNIIVDGENVLQMDNTTITVSKPISSTENITGNDLVANGNVTTPNNVEADGGVTAGSYMSIGDPQAGSYFPGFGALNANYLNVTSPDSFNSSMQLVHGLATGDDIHQMIRMKTDMFDQTPYDHKFGFSGETSSDDRGGEAIGEFFFRYRENGNMAFDLSVENYEFGGDQFVSTAILADSKEFNAFVPFKLLNIGVDATLPTSPITGERFIHNGVLKIYADGVWNNYDPGDGSMVYDTTNNRTLVRENGAWRAITTTAI